MSHRESRSSLSGQRAGVPVGHGIQNLLTYDPRTKVKRLVQSGFVGLVKTGSWWFHFEIEYKDINLWVTP